MNNMDKIKNIAEKGINWIKNWYVTNWNGGIFDRGKTIFVSFVILIILIGLIS
tara:strand:+ start:557 stop:715 length:159 start_codon:yes stop_codon:yes gene_type:complete